MTDTPRLYLAATGHIYNGLCPDDEQPNARDKECPACRLLIEVERGGWKLAPVEPTRDMREAAREDGWQPIETAPKDGTRVLLWFEWHDLPVVGDFRHGRWWSVHSLGGNLAHPSGMDWEEVVRPTYWRPLPAPPAIDRARGRENGHD